MDENAGPREANRPGRPSSLADRHGLVRPRQGRYVAGVCVALGRATGTDPVLWRVLLAVLVCFGGVGVLAYLAVWLLTPEEGDTASPIEAALGRGHSATPSLLVVVLSVVALVTMLVAMSRPGYVVLLGAAVALVVMMIQRQRRGPPPSAPPAASPPPPGGPAASGPSPEAATGPTPPEAAAGPTPPEAAAGPATGPATPLGEPVPPATSAAADAPRRRTISDLADADPVATPLTIPIEATPPTTPPTTAPPTAPPPAVEPPPQPTPTASPFAGPRPYPEAFAPHGPFAHAAPPRPMPPPPRPRPPKERSALPAITFFTMLIGLGVLGVLDLTGATSIPATGYLAAGLTVVGAGLLVGAWMGRGRSLIVLGIVLALALPTVHLAAGWTPPEHVATNVQWSPTSAADLQQEYALAFGEGVLDLRNLDFAGQRHELTAQVNGGEIWIHVPPDVPVTVEVDARAGSVTVFGAEEFAGLNTTQTREYPAVGEPVDGELVLTLQARFGHIGVTR